MCTVVLSLEPGAPVLLAGFRDELADRAWQPPQRYWPGYPELIGGRDLLAGGTWLAVAPSARRAACVLNGRGTMAPARSRRSRGVLPLQAAADGKLTHAGLEDFDPFHLLVTEPGRGSLTSWDGQELTERELPAGLHMIVNSGLGSDLLVAGTTGEPGHGTAGTAPGDSGEPPGESTSWPASPTSCPGFGARRGPCPGRAARSRAPGETGCRCSTGTASPQTTRGH